MAIDSQIELLTRDVDGWNRWRNVYGHEEHIDLSHADLSGANLSDADLSDADLRFTDLTGANLSGANLSGANLTDANLTDAMASEHTQWPTEDFDFAALGVTIGYY